MRSNYQARRTLRRDGVLVDHYDMVADDVESSRGTPYSPSDESPISIAAIPDPGGKTVAYGQFGVEVDAEMVYLVHEAEDVDDGGGEGASVIVQEGRAYRVDDRDATQPHGFAVLECSRDPEVDLP
jgi:hypothetical protein